MTDYKHPGSYIQEVPSGPGPITGVSTSNLGLIGFSTKGPVNEPILSTSFPEWSSKFGGFTDQGLSAHEAYAFFANGGQFLYFVRVVADDAAVAYWDFANSVASELVSNVAEATGVYEISLDQVPVLDRARITFNNAGTSANVYVFDMDDDGVLTLNEDESGATAYAAGGSGAVDTETGEANITLGDASLFTGGSDYIIAAYDYSVFRFRMKWPGLAGNFYRVIITPGSDDYLVQEEARWTRFSVTVEEDMNSDVNNRNWTAVETFSDLVFDDANDNSYVATVINADNGSDFIEVVDYGNGINPLDLAGVQVTAEDISGTQRPQGSTAVPPVAYDGLIKGWEYTLANGAFQNTVHVSFQMADGEVGATGSATADSAVLTDANADFGGTDNLVGKVVVNITQGASAVITSNDATTITGVLTGGAVTWVSGDEYAVVEATTKIGVGDGTAVAPVNSPGTASNPVAIVPGTVSIKWTDSLSAEYTIIDDGSGNLWDGVAGSVGDIDYTTGQITDGTTDGQIDVSNVTAWSSLLVENNSDVLFSCIYAEAIALDDDADGNMLMSDTQATGHPAKFQLNSVGVNTIDYDTGVINLTWKVSGNPVAGLSGVYKETVDYYTEPEGRMAELMVNGTDGSDVTSSDLVDPSLAVSEEGIYAFGKADALMQLVAADFQTDTVVSNALITYAELVKDKFVILTVPHGLSYQEAVNWKKFQLNRFSSYAAIYYSHVKILDPVTNINTDIPCGGHVAGVYARTDSIRNVGEAPAGMEKGKLNWSVGLEVDLTETQVGVVYKNKINALVQWPHTGRVVWGARTIDAAGGEWKYINSRRLFIFAEKSVFNATHVHVFENNGPTLWGKIQGQVSTFLLGLHQSGYLAGSSPDESFFVICDRTNNPENTMKKGIVFTDVGIAPNKPGEFLVFRFQQKALSSSS